MKTHELPLAGFVASVSCFVLLASLCGCQSKADFDKARWTRWKGDDAAVGKLDKEVSVLGIKIRPPRGFESQPIVDGPENSKLTSWIQRRDDGTVRAVQLMVVPIVEEMGSPTAVQALKNLYGDVRPTGRRGGSQQDPVEMGFVNDVEFARTSWKRGNVGFDSNAEEGYFYVAIIGDKIYQLMTKDTQEAPDGELDVCHASILSFKN